MIIVEKIANPAQKPLQNLGRLSIRTWAASGNVPAFLPDAGPWNDGHNCHAHQWAAFVDGTLVARARLCVHKRLQDLPDSDYFRGGEHGFSAPIAALSQLMVLPEACGQQILRILDGLQLGFAKYLGAKSAAILTNVPARLEYLPGLGFKLLGEKPERTAGERPSKVFALVLDENFSSRSRSSEDFASGPDSAPNLRTANRMGWCAQVPSEITEAFIEAAAGCSYPVLDIGAGLGLASLKALERRASVTVNDLCPEHLAHFARTAAAAGLRGFKIAMGRIPGGAAFPDGSFDAIHASSVFHFLTPPELADTVRAMGRWLRPGGRAFVQTASPYVGGFGNFYLDYEARKKAGEPWPGFMENLAHYASEETATAIPAAMNMMTAGELAAVFRNEGFIIERAYQYRRAGLPSRFHFDGREESGVIARR